jgi:glycerol kinase
MRFVLALDQGTTSSRAIVFGREGNVVASAQQEFPQIFPGPGHVEHDPEDIWSSQLQVARDAMARAQIGAGDLAAVGITNQRETTILWDRRTGKPVANAIVWQSRISAGICDALKADGHEELFRSRTGLVVDAYFSGTKIKHLLETVPGLRSRAECSSAPWTRSSSGGSPAAASTSPTSATPAARSCSTSTRWIGTTSC